MTKFVLTAALIVLLACGESPAPTSAPTPTSVPDPTSAHVFPPAPILPTQGPPAPILPAQGPADQSIQVLPHDYEPEPCLPWLTGGLDAAYYDSQEKARELLEGLGVEGLDGMELFSWGGGSDMTTGGRSSRYEFKYWLKDEAGEKALGVSEITIEATQESLCDVKLVDTGLWRRVSWYFPYRESFGS